MLRATPEMAPLQQRVNCPEEKVLLLYDSLGHSPCFFFSIKSWFCVLCVRAKERNMRDIIKEDEELCCVLFGSCYLARRSEHFHGRAGQIKWKHIENGF